MKKTRIHTRIKKYEKNIQMFEKNAYKHAFKCRKKTRIQMYEKNAYKHAFKCMKKTSI